jgi:hypothetical protein
MSFPAICVLQRPVVLCGCALLQPAVSSGNVDQMAIDMLLCTLLEKV